MHTITMTRWRTVAAGAALAALGVIAGCVRPPEPDYARPLPAGAPALRKIDPGHWPDLPLGVDAHFHEACQRSLQWFQIPSTTRYYPVYGITHDQAHASVAALHAMLLNADNRVQAVLPQLQRDFDLWESVGWDNKGTVFFTGYYAPNFSASAVRTERFSHPLYRRPPNLLSDPASGQVLGWQGPGGQRVTPPTRAQIEGQNLLAGQELVWLASRLEAYIVQVNGSARLAMTDGSTAYVGYAGTNGHEYTSIGQLLVRDGKISRNRLSLPAIRAYFRSHPSELDAYIQRNDRFVFFSLYSGSDWPAGSLGFPVTAMRTLATDKSVFPRGGVVMIDTRMPVLAGGTRRVKGFMLDQDTGGAIRAAGRADIYLGVGPTAETLAGRQAHEGRLYYLLLKPDRVERWLPRLRGAPAGAGVGSTTLTGDAGPDHHP